MLNTTPVALNGFSRFMSRLFDERDVIGVSTGGQAFFGRPEANGSETLFSDDALIVDIDIIRGNERTAALVPRGSISNLLGPNQKNANEQNYTSVARSFPLSIEQGNVNANQILQRMAGETSENSGVTKFDRMRMLALKQIKENMRRTVRLHERLAWQSILNGTQDSILGGPAASKYDFYRSDDNTIGVATPWDDDDAIIMSTIDAGCIQARLTGKETPDMMVVGSAALEAALENTKFANIADNRRFELMEINDKLPVPDRFAPFIAGGMIPRGRLLTGAGYELWIFTYNEIYTDEDGDSQNYMSTDKAVICSSRARLDRYFGPSEKLPSSSMERAWYMEFFGIDLEVAQIPENTKAASGVVVPGMFHHSAYESRDRTTIVLELQSAPIFATTQTDTIVVLEDLIT